MLGPDTDATGELFNLGYVQMSAFAKFKLNLVCCPNDCYGPRAQIYFIYKYITDDRMEPCQ